ncbi:dinitrogenase iron-molybdenum cofactor N-terminal domain-containing protein [Billgrantia endophytica]|uniref:Nitrogen fixation protein NifY n=1 Tax=Billgrantia endophytica TaxID=2033802 RepID=A0A2N7U021_9GAMM|nr:dinitrogenase iron-molybdenum cofactor N-terminal domain-containing protein [Halomonas endophytica]PMR73787.1 nitrogen fixation protein NifY [Halomonas endophytica]
MVERSRLPAHLALRIALAARELSGVETARLLDALLAATGGRITEARLGKLRLARLRACLRVSIGVAASVPSERQLQRAVGLLKGRGVSMPEEPLPIPLPYCEGEDLCGSVRIACASNEGERLDGRFSNCARFLIYQISPCANRLIALRQPAPPGEDEDRHTARAELLRDCQLLYTLSIGAPAAAKVVRAGVHPVKVGDPVPAREIVEELQRVLAAAPPPWLAKAMGVEPDQRLRFICNRQE